MRFLWREFVFLIAVAAAVRIADRDAAAQTPRAVSPTPSAPADTYGMRQYTDQNYGFSFWFPAALSVVASAMNDDKLFPGGTTVQRVQIGSSGGVSIVVVSSPGSSITDEPTGHASPIPQTRYFYDGKSRRWMVAYPEGSPDGSSSAAPKPADMSRTTMAGMPMLPSGRRFDTSIIPLSATRFLVVGDGGGSAFTQALARTVSPVGATIDPSTQSAALRALAAAAAGH
jgi:hypothetical protein